MPSSDRRNLMPTANINGIEIYYRIEGRGDRVVMTHGSWTSADIWRALTPLLSDRYEMVAWDRRGHSRRQDGDGPGSTREDASDLAALLEHLGGDPVHLVGNSSGGSIVLNLVAARPELVERAAVHEPGTFALLQGIDDETLAAERAGSERVRQLLEEGRYREAAHYFVDELAVGPGAWNAFPPELRDTLEANARTFLDEIDEPFETKSIDWDGLVDSATPLLVTSGTESTQILRPSTEELARRLPVRWEILTRAGHVPHRTHAEDYAGLLVDFFERSPSVL